MGGYGRKGGTSATAGRRATTYEATLPDGKVVRKKSFHVHSAEAALGCYEHRGSWFPSGIRSEPQPWQGQQWITARRV